MHAAGLKNGRSINGAGTMLAAVAVLIGTTGIAEAQYPKVNLAIGYEVDPDWPDKPDEIQWRYMTGVAVDSQDRVWTLNSVSPQVQVYSAEGKLLDSWGDGYFKMPHFIRIDPEGFVWTADFRKHVVMKFSEKGELLLTLGTPDKPGADETHLNGPTDITFAPNGDLFVTDGYGNNRIMHFNAKGEFVKTWGKLGQAPGELSQPHSIAIDSKGRLYVAERNNCRIQIFDQSGKSLAQWRNLVNPWGLWISPKDEVYVCGSAPARWTTRGNLGNPPTDQLLMVFDTTGRALQHWVFPLAKEGELIPGHLDWIHGMGVDSKGNVYLGDVADNSKSHRVQKFNRLPAER
jgi:sugar lactone lactonase YvrE